MNLETSDLINHWNVDIKQEGSVIFSGSAHLTFAQNRHWSEKSTKKIPSIFYVNSVCYINMVLFHNKQIYF